MPSEYGREHLSLADLDAIAGVGDLSKQIEDLNRRGHAAEALLTCSYLEEWLRTGLEEFFENGSKRVMDKLCQTQGPLGSFSHKIDIAFCLGVISQETRSTLHTLRGIRNKFAHPKGEQLDYDKPAMDTLFAKLDNRDDENRQTVFLRAAVSCINDIKAKIEPKIRSDALIKVIKQRVASREK